MPHYTECTTAFSNPGFRDREKEIWVCDSRWSFCTWPFPMPSCLCINFLWTHMWLLLFMTLPNFLTKFGAQVFSNNALFFDVIVLHHQCNNRSLLIFHPIDDVLVHNIILREWEIWILTELLIFLIFY